VLAHPLTGSALGSIVNLSYTSVSNGDILQLSDPNLVKTIILSRAASFGGKDM
jgi:hypothetical protein